MISVFYIKAKLIAGQYYNLYFSEISSNPIIECIGGEFVSFSTLLYSVEDNYLMYRELNHTGFFETSLIDRRKRWKLLDEHNIQVKYSSFLYPTISFLAF